MARRLAVLTDAHANLPGLETALTTIREIGCDAIFHTGDAIGIGPYPAECLVRLLHTPGVRLVMGNHDALFAHGPPHPCPPSMSVEEETHQRWTHAQLDPALRPDVARWPYVIEESVAGVRVAFIHYALDATGRDFLPIVPQPEPVDLDRLFGRHRAEIVFYGHHHPAADHAGRGRYVNPGALECGAEPVARFVVLSAAGDGSYALEKHTIPYDRTELFRQFDAREVLARDFIRATFFAQRLS